MIDVISKKSSEASKSESEGMLIGSTFNSRYKVIDTIGRGAFGFVVLVYDSIDKEEYLFIQIYFRIFAFLIKYLYSKKNNKKSD